MRVFLTEPKPTIEREKTAVPAGNEVKPLISKVKEEKSLRKTILQPAEIQSEKLSVGTAGEKMSFSIFFKQDRHTWYVRCFLLMSCFKSFEMAFHSQSDVLKKINMGFLLVRIVYVAFY